MTDEYIIDDIETSEGWPKYTDLPNDLGGSTKGGITLATLRAWRNSSTVTIDELKNLGREEARAIYQFMFVQPFNLITDSHLKHYLADLGVLRGPRKATMMLQEIVGAFPVDGWLGKGTIKAMEKFKSKDILVMLIGARFAHIEQRIRENPSQIEYRQGWRNRNTRFLA